MKRTLCLLLVAIMLSTTLSVPAFATNSSGHETTVTYTVDTQYTVIIPESIDLNSCSSFEIQAHTLLDTGKHLYVRVDKDMSLVDGKLLLYKDGDENASTISCTLTTGVYGDFTYLTLEETDYTVAVFENANSKAIEYGGFYVGCSFSPQQEFGTYYGTLYFTFSVE